MSILGVGTDLVEIARVRAAMEHQPERFPRRLLTPGERLQVPSDPQMATAMLAKRWAAKEAVAKAFGTGIGCELSFQDIEIEHSDSGAPTVVLSPRAQLLAEERHLDTFLISISDERAYALAFVVASALAD